MEELLVKPSDLAANISFERLLPRIEHLIQLIALEVILEQSGEQLDMESLQERLWERLLQTKETTN